MRNDGPAQAELKMGVRLERWKLAMFCENWEMGDGEEVCVMVYWLGCEMMGDMRGFGKKISLSEKVSGKRVWLSVVRAYL